MQKESLFSLGIFGGGSIGRQIGISDKLLLSLVYLFIVLPILSKFTGSNY